MLSREAILLPWQRSSFQLPSDFQWASLEPRIAKVELDFEFLIPVLSRKLVDSFPVLLFVLFRV